MFKNCFYVQKPVGRLQTQEMESQAHALPSGVTATASPLSLQQGRESGSLGGIMGVSLISVENMSGMCYFFMSCIYCSYES